VSAAEAACMAAQKSQDKTAEVKALQDLIKAYQALPDQYEAVRAAQNLLKLHKASSDTKGQAQTLLNISEMQLSMNNLQDAKKSGQEAMDLFKAVREDVGQEKSREVLSWAYNKLGQVEIAPNRAKGLAALSELSRALEASDKTRFYAAMDRCKRMSSVSEADIEEKLGEALEKDYMPTAKLFKECLDIDGLLPQAKGIMVSDRYHYMAFRTTGGLQYGPAFQCVRGVCVNESQDAVMAPVIIPDDRESWEHETAFHAGLLDGIIQVPFSAGLAHVQISESNKAFAAARETKIHDNGQDALTN